LPKILVLDYKKWRCGGYDNEAPMGHGKGETALLNDFGYECCLGQFSRQCGVPKKTILNVSYPGGCGYPVVQGLSVIDKDGDYLSEASKFSNLAIDINDDEELTVAQKAHKLTLLCSKYKRKLLLKNFPKSVLGQIKGKHNVWKSWRSEVLFG